MRILRWIGGLLLLALLVVGVGAAWLYLTFDPEDYKARITQQVAQQTGRTLIMDGPLKLTFYPRIGLEAETVSFGNPAGFPGDDFLTARRMGIKVDLMPLIDGHLVVDTLELEGVGLNLHRTAEGQENWADLLALGAGPEPTAPGSAAAGGSSEKWIRDYVVRGVELTDARVQWRDDQSGASYVLDGAKLMTGAISPGAAVPVEAGFRLASGDHGAGRLDATGELTLSEDLNRLQVPDLALTLTPEAGPRPVEIRGGLTLDRSTMQLEVTDFRLDAPGGVTLSGRFTAELGQPVPGLAGHFALAPFDPHKLASELGAKIPPMRDPSALTRFSGEFDLDATVDKVVLKPLTMSLDDTRIDGEVTVAPGASPLLSFRLRADALDGDRYLAPEVPGQQKNAEAPGGSAAGAAPASPGLGLLGVFDAQGSFAVGKVKVSGLNMSDVNVSVRSGGGKVSLAPMKARLYGGDYQGSLNLEAAGNTVNWRATEKLTSVQIGPFLKDLTGDDKLQGAGNMEAQLQGTGLSDAQIRRTVQGKATFVFTDGALKGINLAQLVRDVKARLKGKAPETSEAPETDFSELSGTLGFGKGKVRNQDLVMKSPYIRVGGKGEADLVTEKLNYLLTAKVVGTAKGQGGGEATQLAGVVIPVKVRGTFSDPSFEPDLDEALKQVAGKRLDEEKARLEKKAKEELADETGKLEEKVQDELGKALKKLF